MRREERWAKREEQKKVKPPDAFAYYFGKAIAHTHKERPRPPPHGHISSVTEPIRKMLSQKNSK